MKTLKRYLSACERLDPDEIAGCFAADARLEDPSGTVTGTAAIHRYFVAIYSPLSALKFEITPAYWCGPSCAIQWTGWARLHDGTVKNYAGIDVFELNPQGLIRELRAFWDPAELNSET